MARRSTSDAVEYLGEGEPLVMYDYGLPPMPCYRCGAVRVGSVRATCKIKVTRTTSWFRCRVCGQCFQLPRREISYWELSV